MILARVQAGANLTVCWALVEPLGLLVTEPGPEACSALGCPWAVPVGLAA